MKKKTSYEPHRFPYLWKMADGYPAKGIEPHGCKVFGTFICGGGSSMGYKLAGYNHLGGVELDPQVAATYKANHHPEYLYIEDIRDFNKRTDLPDELYQLDILDGSPPCSTFSMAGSREKAWGKEKKFAEGQKMQRLDDLVFVYCDTIKKLMPKVCLLENVAGLVKGNSKVYAKQIVRRLQEIGYNVQTFLLNGATMGVPQMRERVFFIGLRKDFHLPKLVLNFNEEPIKFGEIYQGKQKRKPLVGRALERWESTPPGSNPKTEQGNTFGFLYKTSMQAIAATVTSSGQMTLPNEPYELTDDEFKMIGTFPIDYQFANRPAQWYIGMSVPPIMTAQISWQIYKQWLSKIGRM